MSVLLVVNYASGSFDAGAIARAEKELGALGNVTRFTASSAQAFAEELRRAAASSDLVTVAGGDGSLSLAVDALRERHEDIAFALLPMGTGNDLATTLALSGDIVEVAAGIVVGSEMQIDLGRVRGDSVDRLFVNASVGGFSVDVDRAVEEETKRKLGRFAFWLGGVRAAKGLTRYRVHIDGRSIDDAVVVGVGNGRTVGGGLELWPDASVEDGELDVCVISASGMGAGVRAAVKVKQASHEDLEGVTTFRASRLEIESAPPMEMNADGEVIGIETPLVYEVAGRFRMRVPR